MDFLYEEESFVWVIERIVKVVDRSLDNIVGENTETILFFTNKGNYYHLKMGEFYVDGKHFLSNYFSINDNETFTAAVALNPKNAVKFIVFIRQRLFK